MKSRVSPATLTAAHLAGIRPRTPPRPIRETCDPSTTFLAGIAITLFLLPMVTSILPFTSDPTAPHSAGGLFLVIGVLAVFGIFPLIFGHHVFLQRSGARPNGVRRAASTLVALGGMMVAMGAIKPLVGYDEKLAEVRRYAERTRPGSPNLNRLPASGPSLSMD